MASIAAALLFGSRQEKQKESSNPEKHHAKPPIIK
jgi:hypothetical protein